MKLRGTGVGSMFYGVGNTGLPNPAAAFCEVLPDTSVNVTIGAADIGQGVRHVLQSAGHFAVTGASGSLPHVIQGVFCLLRAFFYGGHGVISLFFDPL